MKEIEVCDFRYDEGLRSRVEKQICPTITTHTGGGISSGAMIKEIETIENQTPHDHNLRIRKLTPKECWLLMGFDNEDFEKASKVNSNAQLYKQAGNSIVVNVLEAIFKQLF